MYIEIIVVKKTTGYDEIPGKLFTKAHVGLFVLMLYILNTCINVNIYYAKVMGDQEEIFW